MELTAETFSGMAEQWDFSQRLAIRAALGSNRMGLVPGAPFNCSGTFVSNRFEITGFQCMALLLSGRIVNADEDVQVPIPMLFGDKYYLTVGFGSDQAEFQKRESHSSGHVILTVSTLWRRLRQMTCSHWLDSIP